jgi:hypothetical protein
MKNNIKLSFITTLVFIVIGTACCKKRSTIIEDISTNTVTCIINGQNLTSTGGKPSDNALLGCQTGNYISSSALGGVNYAFDFNFCMSKYAYNMQIYINDSLKVKKYVLDNTQNRFYSYGLFYQGRTDATNTGIFEITSITDHRIVGNFNINITTLDSPFVAKITNGKFGLPR